MPGGFPNFRSLPDFDQKALAISNRNTPKAEFESSASSFHSDTETLKHNPQERSLMRAIKDAMKHIAPKQSP
ncbi:hypothetical protein BGW36DRAFT_466576 [Talaromyces proteolyticus]|uniref:Uncharacterized protein n=1 Tax=Talaromyces proteolyticus TaxID=1131652 RepID=A0AAD4KEK8_9EURO|nr:uncharacterized protein BGW36DRAFT_466576 [Talaromyces proteolyticus]KAH8688993.1 hypothetical protein BGW36DRAFT_466576 [Talaromyces proteolyticus]